mgnify:CR=1 FL=1
MKNSTEVLHDAKVTFLGLKAQHLEDRVLSAKVVDLSLESGAVKIIDESGKLWFTHISEVLIESLSSVG